MATTKGLVKGKDYKTGKDLIGRKVKTVAATSGHGYGVGAILTISRAISTGATFNLYDDENPSGGYFRPNEIIFMPQTIEAFEEEIDMLKKSIDNQKAEIKVYESRIKFMKANKLKEFSEEEFKVYAVLEQIEAGGSKLEQAKAIAKIISG